MKKLLQSVTCIAMILTLFQFQEALSQNIVYEPLFTNGTFTKSINVNLPVGTVAASADAMSGAGTYSIPITIPAGTNGVAPSVTITYNSMGGNGLVGQGWGISGLSTISRIGRTIYHDGKTAPVNLDADDRFLLDDSRLLSKSGTYGADGATYGPEHENFSTITSNGNFGGGPMWFRLEAKDGVVMEYGNSTDSRFLNHDNTKVLYWRLNKIIYKDGNYIEYKYQIVNNESLISEINYTGNAAAGLLPYNKVKFNFLQRLEKTTTYSVNTAVKSGYLLDNIVITAENNQVFKTYYLKYGHDNITSYLKEFKEAGSNGALLNSTIFKYGDTPNGFELGSSNVVAGQSVDLFSGDFDADGYSDILAATFAYHNNTVKYHTGFKIYKRTATNGSYSLAYEETFPSGELWQIVNKVNTPKNTNFYSSDFTGDGRDDIMINKLGYNSSGSYKVESFNLYTSTSTGGYTITFTTTAYAPYSQAPGSCGGTFDSFGNGVRQYFFPGDYDGDGATDFVTILSNGNSYKVFISFPRRGEISQLVFTHSNGCAAPQIWLYANYYNVIDFNGDGKSDLMLTLDDQTKIFDFSHSGLQVNELYASGFPTKWHLLYFGDFNGDGKTDILSRTSTSNINNPWYKAISTGTAFIETSYTFNHKPDITGSSSDDKLVISDYNSDGKADIFHAWNYFVNGSASTSRLDLYYSKGDDFHYLQHVNNNLLGFVPLISYDLNGDGRTDLVSRDDYQEPFDIFYFRKEGQEQLLQKVKNGVDHDIEFAYKRLTQTSNFYTRGSVIAHPVNNLQLPIYLISQFKAENGISGFSTVNYSYNEVKLHKEGKGFMGIKLVTANNLTSGIKMITESEFSSTRYVGAPYKSSTYLASNNTLLSETTHTNQFVQQGGSGSKRVWVRINSSYQDNVFEKRFLSTVNTYDIHGNVTQKITDNGVESTTTATVFGAFGTPIPAKPTSVTVSYLRSGNPAYSVTSTYAYNAIGQLTSKTDFSGQPQNVVTTYTYNNLGNQTGTTVTPSGMPARSGSSTYDTKGRYPLTITNALGQTASATYDPKWGKALSETGIDGLTTSYNYDAFGRLQTTTMPQGWTITQTYAWGINPGEGTIHYLLTSHPGKPDTKLWYDLLDRVKKTETEGFQNQWITTKTTYDARGNVATSTTPYKTGEAILTNTNSYDTYNRLVATTNSLGTATIAYSYDLSGNLTTTTTNPAGQVSSNITDPSGKTISATDNGGTLTYSYNSQGNLKQVVQGSTVLIQNEYDIYARQTKLTDINAGITQYAYNALGQLTSQTSALNQTTTITYDLLDRMTQRTGPEGNTTNEYFLSGSGASTNRIKKITGFSGDIQEYTYDNFGRTSTDKTTIDGVGHTTTYSYDTYSNVTSLVYPSGFTLNQAYDANGYLVTLKNGNNSVTLFTNTGMNGFNQFKNYTLGNGKASANTYNFGTPTRYFTTGLQDLYLSWDLQSGNLTSRYDAIKAKTESFTYDNLNRLLTSSGAGIPTLDMTFAGNGNIISKTDVGNYTYGNAKINAVTMVTNPSLKISDQTQDITYTPYFQPATVSEGNYLLTYTYGSDQQRIKGVLAQNGSPTNTRYYLGGYEKDITGNSTKHLHYISNGQSLIAIVVRENGTDTYNYVYTDHIGSILTVTDNSGVVIAEQNFDAWGRNRNTVNWSYVGVQAVPAWLYRGFTGHEQLSKFSLINMNGRMYDPMVGRMLSADNHVQTPDFTQNYNRYSYALNNPLRYTDQDGEYLQTGLWLATFLGEVTNNLIYGNANAVGSALNQANSVVSTVGNVLQVPIYQSGSTTITAGINPFIVGVSASIHAQSGNLSGSATVGIGLVGGAYVGGSVSYSTNGWTFGAGISANSNSIGGGVNFDYEGFGAGYYQTKYDHSNVYGQDMAQVVGGLSLSAFGAQFDLQNDFLAGSGDKFRSNAWELSYGHFVVGSSIYTNNPGEQDQEKIYPAYDLNGKYSPGGVWSDGRVYSAPLWVGTKFGNTIDRVGYSHPKIQNAQQNYVHRRGYIDGTIWERLGAGAPYYLNYDHLRSGFYTHSSFYNPYSLFKR